MPVVALIPIRSFADGKDRLSPVLDDHQRRRLSQALAAHTVNQCELADLIPVIITSDSVAANWATAEGLQVVEDSDSGLNRAAHEGMLWANEHGLTWVIVHSDLPLVTATELTSLKKIVERGHELIAPSSDGGTSALSAVDISEFRYGPGSASRHIATMTRPTIHTSTGLLHDLDSVNDLQSALGHARGRWIQDVISGIEVQ